MDLNTATNEQLEVYRATVAKTMSIDPLMLDFIWMNDPESGLRNRVLYAKRGAAEVLRHELKVSVTSLVMSESSGLVTVIATGSVPSGRQEMAVGSAYIEGLRGDKKAHGIMTASTRAVRRLTLQFVTGGVLDETEVQAQSDLQIAPAASTATLAGSPVVVPSVPQTAPSALPGKDITPSADRPIPPELALPATVNRVELPTQTPEEFSATQQALRDEAKSQLENNPPAKAKRTRKSRNTVSIASPGQTEMPVGTIGKDGIVSPSADIPAKSVNADTQVSAPANEVPVSAPPVVAAEKAQSTLAQGIQAAPLSTPQTPTSPAAITAQLSPEKVLEFKNRLRVYSNDILPKGNMLPVDGVGGVTMQLRKFAQVHTGAPDTNVLSVSQWEDLFDFLDTYTKENGPTALVQYISKAIGVTK